MRVALTSVLLAALTGCGGGSGTERGSAVQAITRVSNEIDAALKDGDAQAVCDRLTPGARKEVLDQRSFVRIESTDCAAVVKALIPHSLLTSDDELGVHDIVVSGDIATAKSAGGSEKRFRRIDGRWALDTTSK